MMTCIVKDLREEDAVPLMDNCSPHITPPVIELLSTARVRVIVATFTPQPQTTQIFQVLDLLLFGVLKRRGPYQLPFEDDFRTAWLTQEMYYDFRRTMIQPNIWEAF
jgi:hypothetical protein